MQSNVFFKPVVSALTVLLLASMFSAQAHETAVTGEVVFRPNIVSAGEPFLMRLSLTDTEGVPVDDAWIEAEFRQAGAAINQYDFGNLSFRFRETETIGLYETRASVPEDGGWQIILRDETYRQETAEAVIGMTVGGEEPVSNKTFGFPATSTQGEFYWFWMSTIIGAPLLIVLAVVFRIAASRREELREAEAAR